MVDSGQRVLGQEQLLLTHHSVLATEPQHGKLIVEIAGAAVPAIVYRAETRERCVQADNASVPPLL